jgi:hypothetical protein
MVIKSSLWDAGIPASDPTLSGKVCFIGEDTCIGFSSLQNNASPDMAPTLSGRPGKVKRLGIL